jgi:hypothetical protein
MRFTSREREIERLVMKAGRERLAGTTDRQ